MANWIPFTLTVQHPKVLRVCELTGDDPYTCMGRMAQWFYHVDQHYSSSKTGLGRGAFHRVIGWELLTDEAKSAGKIDYFEACCDAKVGWLREEDGLIVIPEFTTWFGKSAKRRCLENKRKSAWHADQVSKSRRNSSARNAPINAPRFAPENAPPETESESESERESESEDSYSDSESERREGASDSASSGDPAIKSTLRLKLCEAFGINPDRSQDRTALGKQTRSDLTTIGRLIDYAITSPSREDARRQRDAVVRLVREAVTSSGQGRPIAKFIYLAKQAGLYPERVVSR